MPAVRQNQDDSESSPEEELENQFCIAWSGVSRNIPVLLFHAETIVSKDGNLRSIGERYNLAFKILRTESRLVRGILLNHGFREVHPNNNDFSLMWTGAHLKTYQLRSLQDFQKVNHFPRSNELTRKDRLYKNIQRMQRAHGFQKFHIVPQTFVLPTEYQEFCTTFCKDKGPWIIKPVASSRGRGIYLVSSPSQIPLDENILVSRYISNPLLIDDFKFDVRLYVLVTSYDPVIIYIYEEGLTRFATVKYDRAVKNIKNQFMHLTNYSVNKKSSDYVSCDDPEVEDYGNKWSMSALLRYLRQEGKDTTLLMGQIEDLIIKTVLSAEMQIATACKMFVSHRNNCFELYGFDVLIDSNLKPWLLEVNLSPSLACDTPLDLKIKANMISDMFSLVGFVCQDTLHKQARSEKAGFDHSVKTHSLKCQTAFAKSKMCQRTPSANSADAEEQKIKQGGKQMGTLDLTAEELKVLRRTQEEFERRGGFIRIFPTPQTWELYSGYLEYKTSMNSMLANKLFHGRSGKSAVITQSRNKPKAIVSLEVDALKTCHIAQYERKLLSLEALKHRRRHLTDCATAGRKKTGRRLSPSSACSSENEEANEREEREPQGKQEHTMSLAHTDIQPTLRERLRAEEQFPARVSKPRVDLLHILQQGWDLSKVQARMAFSSYLHRVQMRLLAEGRANSRSAWARKDDDQMELIMRFLKRAASNLQQDVRVELPSCQLSLPDRRRLLAHQLGEFIHCYDKETKEMVKSLKKNEDEDRCINPNVFQEFILEASESDLEDVLTFYTHKNKSASVFLGSKCPKRSRTDCDKECHEGMGEPASHYGRKTLANAKEGSSPTQSSVTCVKARHAKNQETHESTAKPGYNKTSETVKTDTQCITIQRKSNKYIASSNVELRNCIRNGDTAVEVQAETLTTSETQNNDIKIKTLQNGDFGSNRPHLTVVENGTAPSKMVKVNDAQPETLRSYKAQARFRGSQHTSSYPAALDCEQIHLQHFFPPSKPEGQPQLQPPPYIQPPPHLQSGTPHKVQTTLSSTNTLRLAGSQEKAEVLQRTQLSQSAQPFSNIASLDTTTSRSAANTYSQKHVWPPPAERASHKACKPRPASAEVFKEPDSPSAQAQSNQQAIVSALKKLVEKQAARQYRTSSHISLLTQHLTKLNLASGVFNKGALGLTDVVQPGTAKTHHSDTNLSGAVSCEAEAATRRPACNLATGTTPQQSHEPMLGSYQLQFAIRQLQQQKLQTRKLLDQSRTRHQAILAAHTVTPDAVPQNSSNSSCGVQVNQQSQMNLKQTMSSKPRNLSQGVTVPTSKLPRDTLSCKVDTQHTKQAPCKGPSSNRLSSLRVYDAMCGKTGLPVYSKLFQTQESSHR